MSRYTFGDDEAAVERLDLVASAYEPTSRSFLAEHVPPAVDVAIDLGCGPGLSTRLLGEVCRPRVLIGIDASSGFVATARARLPGVVFHAQDVTAVPLPGAPASVIYARLLLAHLSRPLPTVELWVRNLAPGGILLIEDLENIEAPPGPLRAYDEVSAEMVRGGGGLMYAGPALTSLGGRCTAVTVPASLAAAIYLFNVRRWAAEAVDPEIAHRLGRLGEDLRLVARGSQKETVSWIVRQIVVQR